MGALDNLVVTMALPVIRVRLHTGLAGLEWTVNAFTLTFAVFLLTGAALGDRFGRRRVFLFGLVVFTAASAAAACAPNIGLLIGARAVQGVGGALLVPLSLTILSDAVAPEKRNMALGIWGALGGAAVALGPVVGGAIVQQLSWQFIFWLNVPIGLVLLPLAWLRLRESYGEARRLDVRGVVLISSGLFGITYGLVRGPELGWKNHIVDIVLVGGLILVVGFVIWEYVGKHPMLSLTLFRNRQFSVTNAITLMMSFGMFGSIFLLAQFLQTVQRYSPLSAGVRTLPWTAMPVVVAPVAAMLVDRFGGRIVVAFGLGFQAVGLAWMATIVSATTPYLDIVPPMICSGLGLALFFVPVASLALGSVPAEVEGVASGTNSAVRELGGVLGISVLGAVFSSFGGYRSASAFDAGLIPALKFGAIVVSIAAVISLANPTRSLRMHSRRSSTTRVTLRKDT
jgi:EmrB/QacA subfamily drug resistance transporter